MAERINDTTLFDELLFCLCVRLGYGSLHMRRNANRDGALQYEILEYALKEVSNASTSTPIRESCRETATAHALPPDRAAMKAD